jgi:hypothetical protein
LYERFRCPLLAARADLEQPGVSGVATTWRAVEMENVAELHMQLVVLGFGR